MDSFYALAEPRRRKVVEILADRGQLSATQIYDEFDVTPQAVSQHLKVLREANVIQMERRAQQRIYRFNPNSMVEIEGWTRSVTATWKSRFDRLGKFLEDDAQRGGSTD